MATEVFMPKTGMDMQEGTIIRWLAEVGDTVRAGEPLLEIETDKVTMEVEAPADGILLCRYFDDGAVVPVVTIIGYIGKAGESVPDRPSMAGGSTRVEEKEVHRETVSSVVSKDYEYRAAIIGGGPAGYTAALRAAEFGGKVILFEKDKIGGYDLSGGSMALRVFLRNAHLIDTLRLVGAISESGEEVDFRPDAKKMADLSRRTVEQLREQLRSRLRASGIEVVNEEASLLGRHTIRAGLKTYRVEKTILCCGSKPIRLTLPGADQPEIIEIDELVRRTEIPKKLVIIGGGVAGCETAAAWVRFGSEVTLLEKQDSLLPTFDEEVSTEIRSCFEKCGIRVLTGVGVEQFERHEGRPVLILNNGNELSADLVVSAIGRAPNLEALGMLRERIDFERGKIMVDEFCRTAVEDIFACGDVTNRCIQAHSAMRMGDAAAMVAMGSPKAAVLNRAPLCLFTIPEAAGIGLTEKQARKQGEIVIGKCAFSDNMRAESTHETEGFVKVIADRGYGEILGVHIVGGPATEMIVEAKTMMDMEITVFEVAEIMHPHPTWSEAFMKACADAVSQYQTQ